MANLTIKERNALMLKRERESRLHRQRARRLAVLKLRWFNTCTDLSLDEKAKGERLHSNELDQRQVKAEMWRSMPDTNRFMGTGKEKHKLDKDHDRWQALHRLNSDAEALVKAAHDRREPPGKIERSELDPAQVVERYGPFDIELDDLDWVFTEDVHVVIQKLSARKNRMENPIKYKPGGGVAGGPQPAFPSSPPRLSGRPTVPGKLPITIEEAESEVLKFGKYSGNTLGWLLGDSEGESYLRWLCSKAEIKSPRLKEALEVMAEHYEGEIGLA